MLLVTKALERPPRGGRELLCKINRDCLKAIYGDRLSVVELGAHDAGGRSLFSALRGYIDGLSERVVAETCDRIRREGITKVFIDGSNLGRLAAGILATGIKHSSTGVHVYTFFHNVETRFFWGLLKQRRTPRALVVMAANYVAERMAVQASDTLVSLSQRDSDLLRRLYGRPATAISPMALHDQLTTVVAETDPAREKYLLFVGGAFYANRDGIGWFAANVAPHVRIKTCIVGHGFEFLRKDLERHKGVEVVGGVDSLAEWYIGAHAVIAPIFDGSGMKTKVAEALMFGKKIVGTPEAFSGYEAIAGQAGWSCSTAKSFIDVINGLQDAVLPSFDPRLRDIYQSNYSFEAALLRFASILGDAKERRQKIVIK
jgi:glycosyltransferase involved in cell wall biosynthesis